MILLRGEKGEMLPVQWVSLHALFAEFLPIALDIYDCAASQRRELLEGLSHAALPVSSDVRQIREEELICMWISDLVYWKNFHPDLYKLIRYGLSI